MDDKNPHIHGLTPYMQAAQNGHLDVCRFFMYGIEEKLHHPIVKFLYLVMLLFLFPHLALFLGFHPGNMANIWFKWPFYFATICFAWFASVGCHLDTFPERLFQQSANTLLF